MPERISPGFDPVRAAPVRPAASPNSSTSCGNKTATTGRLRNPFVSQLRVMYIVDHENGIRMRALTRLLGASPPSVCRLVDRRPCPDSRREVMLCVTPAGRRHLAQVCGRRDQLLLQALDSMPSHQRTALTEGLAALQQALIDQPMLRLVP
ncbi:MarR family winged helix-turn-helix transcriptional regulator [Streptomyces sp. NPDC090798]|uniref:MarR family winged helix-turn-helix transcriptional regulator n=1 Tax=Streptomyces sp. NPDC090798 TaxID=3365968 RepID=UPI00380B7B5D